MKTSYNISQVGKAAIPYKWEAYAAKNPLRFDTNTLPSPPPSTRRRLRSLNAINEYLDPTYTRLTDQISRYEKVPREMVTITNSGDEAIDILAKSLLNPGDRFVITPPTYEMFSLQCRLNRGIPCEIPLAAKTFAVDARAIIRTTSNPQTKLVFLVSPNNPTGSVIPRRIITDIIRNSACIVVVDEAYAAFAGYSNAPLIRRFPNLVVLKTFSKFAGLAGARIGYLVASPELSRIFAAVKLPMGVSALSAELASRVLESDRTWIKNQIAMVIKERKKLTSSLSRFGFSVYPSEANFLLVDMGARAKTIVAKLADNGIIVRDRSAKPYLSGCVRITVRSPKDNKQLITALSKIL